MSPRRRVIANLHAVVQCYFPHLADAPIADNERSDSGSAGAEPADALPASEHVDGADRDEHPDGGEDHLGHSGGSGSGRSVPGTRLYEKAMAHWVSRVDQVAGTRSLRQHRSRGAAFAPF